MATEHSTALKEGKLKIVGSQPIRPDGVDKVTGRAKFGADLHLPGMLIGCTVRSPHAHARIKSIDTSKAEALPGVKAVVTHEDFTDLPNEFAAAGEMMINFHDVTRNVMAREKAMYDGHTVAAVAATSDSIARRAASLIEVEYEPLAHVIDVVEAMRADAPLLHENQFTTGVEPAPDKPSNIAKQVEHVHGDVDAGFAAADTVIERTFDTKPIHQGYIEPQVCVASTSENGHIDLWTTTQGHFAIRMQCAKLLHIDYAQIKVTAAEIGGGFGGKNNVYLEPLAIALSRKARRPVKMAMTRDEVFRGTGPTSGAHLTVKMGCTREGRITAAKAVISFQAGAFPGSSIPLASMCVFTRYDIDNVHVIGHDVTVNRPKVAAYRAPGAPPAVFGAESVIDELAREIGMDPLDFRLLNSAREGTQTYYGATFGPIGHAETLEAAKAHEHYSAPLGPNQGRGVASGFWFNIGGETSTSLVVNEDGTVSLTVGTPDVAGGSRAAFAMMVAEELGIDMDKVRVTVGDTGTIGYNFITAGSRGTFATGMASVQAARQAIDKMRERAAKIWDVPVDGVIWGRTARRGRRAATSATSSR